VLPPLAESQGFDYDVCVLPISVAALMHVGWVERKLQLDRTYDRIFVPGACRGDLDQLAAQFGTPFERGPQDLFDLPEHFGRGRRPAPDLSRYDIEILAEINDAPRLAPDDLVARARRYVADGADIVDLGCIPGESWSGIGDAVRRLKDEGIRTSVDSFERSEVEAAVAAGAELVLSCNGSNVDWAQGLEAELVVVPDDLHDPATLQPTVAVLERAGARFRLDPILEPIGFGLGRSLARYVEVRRTFPDAEMLMGIGNVTELAETDTAGPNLLLAGICQELGIRSVLTTEVVHWARTAVREFDVARRIVRQALAAGTIPKHIDSRLLTLRDPKVTSPGREALDGLAARITDPNFRVFVDGDELVVMNRDGLWRGRDPFVLFEQLATLPSAPDPGHAFYLGYEMAKAVVALTLGKQYRQDQALRWGLHTVEEESAVARRHAQRAADENVPSSDTPSPSDTPARSASAGAGDADPQAPSPP
jgi:dihydropteroate synthase